MRSIRRLLLAGILSTGTAVFASASALPPGPPPADPASSPAVTSDTSATDPRASLVVGEWILAGLLLVALSGAANLARHRGTRPRRIAVDIPIPDPDPTSPR